MWFDSCSFINTAHTCSVSLQIAPSQCWGTLVSWMAQFAWDLTSSMSTVNLYSSTSSLIVLSWRLINISVAAFVYTHAHTLSHSSGDPQSLSIAVPYWCLLKSHRSLPGWYACLHVLITARDLLLSTMTPVAKELASTHTVTSRPSKHQSTCAGSFSANLVMMPISIRVRSGSRTSSSQPVITKFACRFIIAVVTWSQPHTGKYPVNFQHREKMLWQVSMLGNGGRSLPWLHCNLPGSSWHIIPAHGCHSLNDPDPG